MVKKKKYIKKATDKQQQTLRKYLKVRKEFLSKHPLCQIDIPGCTRQASEIHHSGKKNSKELWLDTSLFIACCNYCHTHIENSPTLAKKLNIYNFKV